MTSLPDRTSDPRIDEVSLTGRTGNIIPFAVPELDGSTDNQLEQLTDRIETLANLTSQLCAEVREHPIKWTTSLFDLGDRSYILSQPLPVLVEEYVDDELFYARIPELEVFGEGVTDAEALFRLKQAVLDLFDELTEVDPRELGPLPLTWLRILTKLITKDNQ